MTTEANINETRLPRAVREQMLRVTQRQEERQSLADTTNPPAAAIVDDPTPPSHSEPKTVDTPSADLPAHPRDGDAEYWKSRHFAAEGMYRAARERHQQRVSDLDRELTELREKIRTLETKNRTEPSALDLKLFFTEDQIEHFGEGQCEAMARAAMTAAGQQAQAVIEAEVKPIRERSEQRDRQAAADKEAEFWEKLAELAPNYQEINARQDWLTWLSEVDDATGMVRQDILDRHRGALNGAGVAKMFTTFEKSLKRPTPPVAPPRNAAGGGGGEEPPAPTKGYPSQVEIKDFYKRASIGKVTDKERAEFDARLKSKHAA